MGLTGGIADVGSLYESLVGIHTGQADDSILNVYDEVRRRIWHEVIDPISTENMRRLFRYASPDEAMEKDPFFTMMKNIQEKPPGASGPPNVSATFTIIIIVAYLSESRLTPEIAWFATIAV